MSKLKIVLDTNVFLVSLSSNFNYHWIYEQLQTGAYELFVSNEILTEYAEQVVKRYGLPATDVQLDFNVFDTYREEGFTEGFEKEKQVAVKEMAKRLKQKGLSIGDIAAFTGLTESEIQALE